MTVFSHNGWPSASCSKACPVCSVNGFVFHGDFECPRVTELNSVPAMCARLIELGVPEEAVTPIREWHAQTTTTSEGAGHDTDALEAR